MKNGLVQLIRMGKSIRQIWVNFNVDVLQLKITAYICHQLEGKAKKSKHIQIEVYIRHQEEDITSHNTRAQTHRTDEIAKRPTFWLSCDPGMDKANRENTGKVCVGVSV